MEFNHQTQEYEPTKADFDKCIRENQALKDRWDKLKDDLMLYYTVGSTSGSYGYDVYKAIFDKMQELEKGENKWI